VEGIYPENVRIESFDNSSQLLPGKKEEVFSFTTDNSIEVNTSDSMEFLSPSASPDLIKTRMNQVEFQLSKGRKDFIDKIHNILMVNFFYFFIIS
jgi:hypothetical protein